MANSARQPTPPRLNMRGMQKFLSVVEAPRIENRRVLTVVAIQGIAILAMAIGIGRMLPLKERTPYVVQEEIDSMGAPTGRVQVIEGGMGVFKPTETHVRYYLNQWVQDFLTIDEHTEGMRLPRSFAMLRGQALEDWKVYLANTHQPLERLKQNPEFRERAEVISMNFVTDSTALIRVKLTTRNGIERRLSINLQTAIIAPKNDEEIYRNAIGLWITSFGVSNEST